MGFYIQGPARGKVDYLVKNENAAIIEAHVARELVDDTESAVVVVVDNGPFEAAGFAFNVGELNRFLDSRDYRPKTILSMDRARVLELTGYKY